MNINPGDIVFISKGSFKHDKGASGHPAVVIAVKLDKLEVVICTDQKNSSRTSVSVMLNNTKCLYKPTMAVCNKVGIISKNKVKLTGDKISASELQQIENKLEQLHRRNNKFEKFLI